MLGVGGCSCELGATLGVLVLGLEPFIGALQIRELPGGISEFGSRLREPLFLLFVSPPEGFDLFCERADPFFELFLDSVACGSNQRQGSAQKRNDLVCSICANVGCSESLGKNVANFLEGTEDPVAVSVHQTDLGLGGAQLLLELPDSCFEHGSNQTLCEALMRQGVFQLGHDALVPRLLLLEVLLASLEFLGEAFDPGL